MANSVTANDPEGMNVFILLVNERPEEVTDFKRGLKNAHVLYSSADQSIASAHAYNPAGRTHGHALRRNRS